MRRTFLALFVTLVALPLSAQAPAGKRDTTERELGADRFVAGGHFSVTRPVTGDLIAAGGDVDVSAAVDGDVVVAGGNVWLHAPMKQDIYAAGGHVSINAPVQRNVRLVGGNIELGSQAKIAGNATVAGGEVRVLSGVDGYLQIGGGNVFINGPVGGNLEVGSGQVELGPNARINGRLRYSSRNEIRPDAAAQVQGGIERVAQQGGWPFSSSMLKSAGRRGGWIWSIGLMIIAAVLVGALPGMYAKVGDTVRNRWALSMLIGFIALVCIPIAPLVLLITIVGVPLALISIALYLVLLLVGYVSTGITVGNLALQRFQPQYATRNGWCIAAGLVGMLVVSLLGRVPIIGGLVVLAAMLVGMGALLLQARTRAVS